MEDTEKKGERQKKNTEISDSSEDKSTESRDSDDTEEEEIKVEEDKSKKCTSVKAIGISADRNSRFRRTMEDAHIYIDNFGGDPNQGFFAIYDGHGGRGAVDFTAKRFHEILLDELPKNPEKPAESLRQAFHKTDKEIAENQIQFSGTTAVVGLIRSSAGKRVLYVANCGDARGVINRNGKAVRLSYDHKGSDEGETKRIVNAGGFIVLNRVNGILAVTRSLGDCAMKEYVTSEPFQTETELNNTDTHLILACDGLWDVTSDQEAIDLISSETSAQKMSDKLLLHALKSGSTDNISIMVILL